MKETEKKTSEGVLYKTIDVNQEEFIEHLTRHSLTKEEFRALAAVTEALGLTNILLDEETMGAFLAAVVLNFRVDERNEEAAELREQNFETVRDFPVPKTIQLLVHETRLRMLVSVLDRIREQEGDIAAKSAAENVLKSDKDLGRLLKELPDAAKMFKPGFQGGGRKTHD